MEWGSSASTGATQRHSTQYHQSHNALAVADAIDLQNFDESANVDLQQLFPSAAIGGAAPHAAMVSNSFLQQHHAHIPHSALYYYAPPTAPPTTTSEFFGEGAPLPFAYDSGLSFDDTHDGGAAALLTRGCSAFPTFHADAMPPAWNSAPPALPGVGAPATTALHERSYSDDDAGAGDGSRIDSGASFVGGISPGARGVLSAPDASATNTKFSPDRRKLCSVEGCKSQARAFNRCKRHGGSKRCSHAGCTKSVQSRGLCIRHGGGSRCQESGCTRAAQSHGRCKMHGGGRPCVVADCEKKAHLKRLCRKHGGGAKCSLPGCDKWAQRQGMCMTHSKHSAFSGGGGGGGGASSGVGEVTHL
ncbi:hypothetical protein PybrP1_012298 [[Pythium] brassicae (nom. inval.)]|nr:hypothetical protein PybrP1_012298 [[Pythium] brassicae (nom. inval.)]